MKLSVIVISYNMSRELPRTLRSLSPAVQRGVDPGDYEVIVIDNGSTEPFDVTACRQWLPKLAVHRVQDASPSPVRAVNWGLELAKGELVGVWIDGARLASPGVLAAALNASRLHDWPVIGTLGFHLGPDVQKRSTGEGYDQAVEDRLLAASGWEEDAYRLFDISVFAASSGNGWFVLPNESNALFLRAEHWARLGGYDPGFQSPGGGLANLDLWVRACGDPMAQVILLLGEGTFHQVHGGASTGPVSRRDEFADEYRRLRGADFTLPEVRPWFFGGLDPAAFASIQRSVELREAWLARERRRTRAS